MNGLLGFCVFVAWLIVFVFDATLLLGTIYAIITGNYLIAVIGTIDVAAVWYITYTLMVEDTIVERRD